MKDNKLLSALAGSTPCIDKGKDKQTIRQKHIIHLSFT